MPVYVYRCNECGEKYEIFHKVREEKENIICPHCESDNHQKLMAAASIGTNVNTGSSMVQQPPSCQAPTCQSGMCGLN